MRHLFECQKFEKLNNYHWPYCCSSQFTKKSTADHQGSLEVQEPPKKRTGVWEKRWWTELLTSTIRIWQAFLQILGSNKVHTLWKMDHPKIPSIDSLPALFFCGQQLKAQRQRSFKDLGQIVKNSCQAITFMKTCKMSVKYFCNEMKKPRTLDDGLVYFEFTTL